ncbi:MAG TPA: nitrite/sulfite reductase [Planctomycetota bacterium]|nr:nitrite/sulfite reductase [Planctomycetota bacterium]
MTTQTAPEPNAARWLRLPEAVRKEIDTYETELHRFLAGQVTDKVFMEFRLRHGTYGQRQPGVQMQRIKIPLGMLNAEQMECLADCSEEYSDGISHVTTRQDIQYHFVEILDTPDLFRRLAESGITTREACGNTVRNVTACPYAGVCPDEAFDVTPHARAMAYFLLRHPDAQNFGRKFKIAYSGCAQHHCGLARIHDIGAVARTREVDGRVEHGFEVFVGGGLGAVPRQAQSFDEFVRPEEMLPLAQAIARVFAALGEKKARARARMKFLVENMGIEAFKKAVLEERGRLPGDSRWSSHVDEAAAAEEKPLRDGAEIDWSRAAPVAEDRPLGGSRFLAWHHSNVRPQKQRGYSVVTAFLPLGDITADQFRGLARLARKYVRGTVRTTVAQNIIFRWVSNADLPALHVDLDALGLALPFADGMADITACPGTDSCKLGISSSRGLAAVLHHDHLVEIEGRNGSPDSNGTPRKDVSIKISGCFNSCGQHHIANIGFFGSSKRQGKRVLPVFQVILGGTTEKNAESYGLMVAKVAARRAPDVVRKLLEIFDAEKQDGEGFNDCMERLGKARIHEELAEFGEMGEAEGEGLYYDNRQPWEYVKDVGAGECAGEVVTQAEFLLEDGERLVFEATLAFDGGRTAEAAQLAYRAMVSAADGLLSTEGLLLSNRYDTVAEFRTRFQEAGRFFAGVGEYFLKAAALDLAQQSPERTRKLLEEANLFVEEAHVVYGRMAGTATK